MIRLCRRFFSTSPSTIPPNLSIAGTLEYSSLDKPILKLSKPFEFILALKPYHTINQLTKFVHAQDPTIKSVAVYHELKHHNLERWSQYNTIEDVVSFALKVNNKAQKENQEPRLYVRFNDELSYIKLPTMQERLTPYEEELATVNGTLKPLMEVKERCDKLASSHSNRLVYGGLLGLITQWVALARLTWWEYSWDVIEPFTWFTGMGNSILAYIFFVVFRKDFSCENLSYLTVTSRQKKLYLRNGLDLTKFVEMVDRKLLLEREIQAIKNLY